MKMYQFLGNTLRMMTQQAQLQQTVLSSAKTSDDFQFFWKCKLEAESGF